MKKLQKAATEDCITKDTTDHNNLLEEISYIDFCNDNHKIAQILNHKQKIYGHHRSPYSDKAC